MDLVAVAIYDFAFTSAQAASAAGSSSWLRNALHAYTADTGNTDQVGSLAAVTPSAALSSTFAPTLETSPPPTPEE